MEPTTTLIEKTKTFDDYMALPERAPYQLIGGELVMNPAPPPHHQAISRRLEHAIADFVSTKNLGVVFYAPIDVYLTDTDCYQPDLVFITQERVAIIGEKRIEGPPDLVVEILSVATAYYDLRHKNETYARQGVREYWIVDPPAATVEFYANRDGNFEQIGKAKSRKPWPTQVLKGFDADLECLFLDPHRM